jgi:RimJ/RimL family protein N-acetyltransferase
VNELTTERLLVRPWHDADRAFYAALNTDPVVMHFEPHTLTRAESDARLDEIAALQERGGLGLFTSERRASGELLGCTVVVPMALGLDFASATEIGWRLKPSAWGQGFATEAARALAECAFRVLALSELVSFAAAGNAPSRAVMRRLGMRHDPADDFDHPLMPVGSRLRPQVLYRLAADGYSRGLQQPAGSVSQSHSPPPRCDSRARLKPRALDCGCADARHGLPAGVAPPAASSDAATPGR